MSTQYFRIRGGCWIARNSFQIRSVIFIHYRCFHRVNGLGFRTSLPARMPRFPRAGA